MPWNEWRYPAAIKHLAPAARMKAIEIANALLAEGMEQKWKNLSNGQPSADASWRTVDGQSFKLYFKSNWRGGCASFIIHKFKWLDYSSRNRRE